MRLLVVGVGIAFLIGIGVVVFRAPLLDEVHAQTRPDDAMMLSEGLRQSIDLVNATADHVASDRTVSITSDSADIEQAGELQNNYTVIDHSDPVNYPGYDDCDGIEHLFNDGWSAIYRVRFALRNEQDTQRLLRETRDFWESKGYDVQKFIYNPSLPRYKDTLLHMEANDARIEWVHFEVGRRRGEARIEASTKCLPPE